jgi:hypothetical protein
MSISFLEIGKMQKMDKENKILKNSCNGIQRATTLGKKLNKSCLN